MKPSIPFAATLLALACSACHSEETRQKIDRIEAERASEAASGEGSQPTANEAEANQAQPQ